MGVGPRAAPAAAAGSAATLNDGGPPPEGADEPVGTVLAGSATSRDDAISEAGRLLVEVGAVDASYVEAMHERERSVSTHMGNLLAIPHGTNEAKGAIQRTAISFVRYPDGIDWNGKPTEFVIGIAGAGDDHLPILQKIAGVFVDSAQVERLRAAQTPADVMAVLNAVKV